MMENQYLLGENQCLLRKIKKKLLYISEFYRFFYKGIRTSQVVYE
ncbi:hypothetical protein SLEP1_g4008 [Rubroshorea leprosula]|uniref:Ribosomal protein L32 n=1 Tax=Rubroshorea leprosula TaxID=152421 RepID=A0AAV5HT27_9ROSI|nr:hypothetical protein SLEP1_g4008 [Rubroshorea leprosula]